MVISRQLVRRRNTIRVLKDGMARCYVIFGPGGREKTIRFYHQDDNIDGRMGWTNSKQTRASLHMCSEAIQCTCVVSFFFLSLSPNQFDLERVCFAQRTIIVSASDNKLCLVFQRKNCLSTMMIINVLKCESLEKSKEQFRKLIQKAVDEHEGSVFAVGLSGGSLPNVLAEVLPTIKTDWKKWKFFFCDERMVSFSDKESTFGAYRDIVVPKIPELSLNQFVTIDPALKTSSSAFDYLSKMKQIFSRKAEVVLPRFDLLFLGMGPDGHTCSLFPGHPLLKVCFVFSVVVIANIELCRRRSDGSLTLVTRPR